MQTTKTTTPVATEAELDRRQQEVLAGLTGLQIAEALAVLAYATARLIVEPARSSAEADRATRVVGTTIQINVAMMERDRFGGPVQ